MTRYVVTVRPGVGSLFSYLSFANPPVVPPAQMTPLQIPPPLPPLGTRSDAETYGSRLNSSLRANAAIDAALSQICIGQGFGASSALLFDLPPLDANDYRWEAIHDPTSGFAAIARNCRVARIKRSQQQQSPPVEMPETLRIMAFLSPAKVSAVKEFNALAVAIQTSINHGSNIEAMFLVGENALLNQAHPTWMKVDRIPALSSDFETVIRDFAPHILHFFCHGRAGGGGSGGGPAALELSTVNDWAIEADMGSALLGIDRLGACLVNGSTWLVVLNCCEGGASAPGAQSMAETLVSGNACAAAVGMVEAIDASDATVVTQAFYGELFRSVLHSLANPPVSGAMDFTPAIAAAHQQFYQRCMQQELQQPARFGRWAMPIMYLAAEELSFYGPRPAMVQASTTAMDQAMRDRVAIYARTLRSLPADTPANVREQILALCDNEPSIPIDLRPDLSGNFAAPNQEVAA